MVFDKIFPRSFHLCLTFYRSFKMNGGSGSSQMTVKKLVGINYQYWWLCLEAYLYGQDLWDLVFGDDTHPEDTP